MTVPQIIKVIQNGLEKRGEPGSLTQIADLIGVDPSTVARWARGTSKPRGNQREALLLLYRTVAQAEKGNSEAKKILGALIGAAGAGLLGIGLGGILIAAGLGWILGSSEENLEHPNISSKKGGKR